MPSIARKVAIWPLRIVARSMMARVVTPQRSMTEPDELRQLRLRRGRRPNISAPPTHYTAVSGA